MAHLTKILPARRKATPAVTARPLASPLLRRLIDRIDSAPLFAHSYSHHLNLRLERRTPFDLLEFASTHGLAGLNIHVEDGEAQSLLWMGKPARLRFARDAADRGLKLHIETSATLPAHIEIAASIARDVEAESIRCYPRYEGLVSDILAQTIDDLRQLSAVDPERRFRFTLEQHEDLKSHELVHIVREVGDPRLTLLFDFGNMINACERPEEALDAMSPLITEVHIKDVRIEPDRGGWAHRACRSGEGDLDFPGLLQKLLLLGADEPQVKALALEEENGMYAPAYRFPNEESDPFIPGRAPSTTELSEDEPEAQRLERERDEANRQVDYVRSVLADLRSSAVRELERRVAAGTAHTVPDIPKNGSGLIPGAEQHLAPAGESGRPADSHRTAIRK